MLAIPPPQAEETYQRYRLHIGRTVSEFMVTSEKILLDLGNLPDDYNKWLFTH